MEFWVIRSEKNVENEAKMEKIKKSGEANLIVTFAAARIKKKWTLEFRKGFIFR